MVSYTPTYALPYPQLSDAPNGPSDLGDLAAAVEVSLGAVSDGGGVNNLLINAQFTVDQRAASPATVTTGATDWCSDRWKVTSGTGATNVCTRTAIAVGSFAGAPQYKMAWNRSVAGSTDSFIHQRVENVRTGSGQTVTVAFNAAVASGTSAVTVAVVQNFGTTGSPSTAVTTAGATTVTVDTSTTTRHTVAVAVPTISGKTLGTDLNDYLEVRLVRASGTGTGTVDVWNVQAVIGTTVPGFVARREAEELALCQRYHWQYGPTGTTDNVSTMFCISAVAGSAIFSLPVEMRELPTGTISAASGWRVASVTPTSVSVTPSATNSGFRLNGGWASGTAVGLSYNFTNGGAPTTAYIALTAEI
jgi:hypothetical protein